MIKGKKLHCALVQRGLGVENSGHVKLCNLSTTLFKDKKGVPYRLDQTGLSEIWEQNVTRREIADALDRGERHQNCRLCWDAENSGATSVRQIMNQKYPEVYDELPERPSVVNIKPGNQCNFGCRFCSAEDSNQLYEIDHALGPYFNEPFDRYLQRYDSYKDSFDKNNEFWKVMEDWSSSVDHYALYGGEPFVNKPLFDLLNSNYKNGHSAKQELYVSTNTSVWSEKYIEILKSFKSVTIGMSIDGIGKHFEYIRFPGKWVDIEKNIKKFVTLRDTHKNINLKVAATCNPFNVFYLDQLTEYFDRLEVSVDIHFIQVPQKYDVRILPLKVKEAVVEKLNNNNRMQNVINFISSDLDDREKHLKEFVRVTQGIDKIRGERFSEVFPEYDNLLKQSGIVI